MKRMKLKADIIVTSIAILSVSAQIPGSTSAQKSDESPNPVWTHFCSAFGLFDTNEEKKAHSGTEMEREFAEAGAKILARGPSGHGNCEVLVLSGHRREGAKIMNSIALKYKWLLDYGHGHVFDPRKVRQQKRDGEQQMQLPKH